MHRTAPSKARVCKDCGSKSRPAGYPGPRCFTCHKARTEALRAKQRERRLAASWGLTPEEYDELLAYQGGGCYICRRKPGRRRLAVDHDHRCTAGHPETTGCRLCIRGLLCKNCNRNILGRLKDDPAALERGAQYLRDPPAKYVLGLTRIREE